MTATAQMLETHPLDISLDRGKLQACIDACFECAQACTSCADACLSEKMVADLTTCIGANLDCADLCDTTGRVLSRHRSWDAETVRHLVESCAAACKTCGDECDQHASMHEHCRVCAESCRKAEQACRDLLASL